MFLSYSMLVVCVFGPKFLPTSFAGELLTTFSFVTTANVPQAKFLATFLTAVLFATMHCVIVLHGREIIHLLQNIKYPGSCVSEKEGEGKFVCECVYGCMKFVNQQGCMSACICVC